MTTTSRQLPPFRRNDAQVIRGAYAVLAVLLVVGGLGFLVGFLS